MRFIRNFLILSSIFLAFSAFSAQAQTNRIDASQGALEKKIFKKILSLPYYGVFDHIAFEVNGGTVTLYGKVHNGMNKSDAASVVRRIEGVDQVINKIEILPASGFDNQIRREILYSFSRNGGSLYRYLLEPRPSMRVIVENGHVTLEGFVSNRGDSRLANILANGISGVFSVRNNLIVGKEENR